MIIGNNRRKVIDNIKKCVEEKTYNAKVEIDDPCLSSEEKRNIVEHYLNNVDTLKYKFNNSITNILIKIITIFFNKNTKIVGMENLKDIKNGAIITSNHFNQLDNMVVRKVAQKAGKKKLYVVAQEANLAMKGFFGYLFNYADTIPISIDKEYMTVAFPGVLKKKMQNNEFVLIYPEQEMWFNYRKPRPPKRGAYYYAAMLNVPIVSCFVEIVDRPKRDNDEFYKVKYIIHILPAIYPKTGNSIRENSKYMMEKDYEQKTGAYEQAYGKKLVYDFDNSDIAGWVEKNN